MISQMVISIGYANIKDDPPPKLFQIVIGLSTIADKKICKIQIADTCIPAITIFFAKKRHG